MLRETAFILTKERVSLTGYRTPPLICFQAQSSSCNVICALYARPSSLQLNICVLFIETFYNLIAVACKGEKVVESCRQFYAHGGNTCLLRNTAVHLTLT